MDARDPIPSRLALAASAAFVIGLGLPDLDQILPIGHRSALTHSIAPTLLLLARRDLRALAGGVGIGSGIHLSADVFPNAMIGFATVKLPWIGSIGALPSHIWLALHAVLALALGASVLARLVPRPLALGLGAAMAASAAAYLFVTDGGWPPLALGAGAGACWGCRQLRSGSRS